MIINFSIQNYGSIKDKQTLSFEAGKSTYLEDYYIIQASGKYRLLKLALIYGANGSGKSTILKALSFLRDIVLFPLSQKRLLLDFNPYHFDAHTPHQNTILSIDFLQNDIRYSYEVEYNAQIIVREELYAFNSNRTLIFTRTTDSETKKVAIALGHKTKKGKHKQTILLNVNTVENNTVLGTYLKVNIHFDELKEVIEWFRNYFDSIILTPMNLHFEINSNIHLSVIDKEKMLSILQKAGLYVSDITIKKEEEHSMSVLGFADSVLKNYEFIKDNGKVVSLTPMLEHTVEENKYNLPFELESEGTKRYYELAGLLSILIQYSKIIPIDELEKSLHPDLYKHFLLLFLVNSKSSQLIATTHNRELLSNKDIIRNESIWFCDKSEASATKLYSLYNFDKPLVRDRINILNMYKAGIVGGIPHLGDYYIELSDEK